MKLVVIVWLVCSAQATPTTCGSTSIAPTGWNCYQSGLFGNCPAAGISLSAGAKFIFTLPCTGFCQYTFSYTTTSDTTLSELLLNSTRYNTWTSTGNPAPVNPLVCALNAYGNNVQSGDTYYFILKCDNSFFSCKLWWNIDIGPACIPSCAGKACGSDGCGGACGSCASGTTCSYTNQCVAAASPPPPPPPPPPPTTTLPPTVCVGSCVGRSCGSDGCAGSCGQCTNNMYCDQSQICLTRACTPNCSNKVCGDADGCGGKCGGMCQTNGNINFGQRLAIF